MKSFIPKSIVRESAHRQPGVLIHDLRSSRLHVSLRFRRRRRGGFRQDHRKKNRHFAVIGFFISAIGGLNRILHIWEYENSAHREAARAEALAQPWWPPLKVEKILYQQTRIMRAAPFCPKPRAGEMGSVYEIRSDVIVTGKMKEISAAWEKNLPARERLSPLAAAFANPAGEFESGILNEFLHIWPYRDLNHWAEVQKEAENLPAWDEGYKPYLRSESSEIWYPVAYSPMK